MRESPILFSAPMVRAILEGRKTVTRRLVKPRPPEGHSFAGWCVASTCRADEGKAVWSGGDQRARLTAPHRAQCPYGMPGDRLWVRETWAQPTSLDPGPTFYRADYPECVPAHYENVPPATDIRWKPSIHMPRWASRITLEVTGVRVERVQNITEQGAIAEGCVAVDDGPSWHTAADAFEALWKSLNGADSWNSNPWVWVVDFHRIEREARAAGRLLDDGSTTSGRDQPIPRKSEG